MTNNLPANSESVHGVNVDLCGEACHSPFQLVSWPQQNLGLRSQKNRQSMIRYTIGQKTKKQKLELWSRTKEERKVGKRTESKNLEAVG